MVITDTNTFQNLSGRQHMVQLILIIPGFCNLQNHISLKPICNPKIDPQCFGGHVRTCSEQREKNELPDVHIPSCD